MEKSSLEEIRARFEGEVERFSNLETGQSATMDAPLVLEIVTEVAAGVTPGAKRLLDVGCGAGNYSLKMLERVAGLEVTLVDLSGAMLARAKERVGKAGAQKVETVEGDIREVELAEATYDIILAAAVLHHLRTEGEWRAVYGKLYRGLRAGGSLWVADLVGHEDARVQGVMWRRYGEYLKALKGEGYRDGVFAYIEKEDSPRSVEFQVGVMREVGFTRPVVLHKNACFAAFGGVK